MCDECIEDASKVDEECVCDAGNYFDIATIQCVGCHENCKSCYLDTVNACTECEDGYYKQKDADVCVPWCPTGLTPELSAECSGVTGKIACFTFDNLDEVYSEGELSLTFTSLPNSVYLRGAWFDGVADYFTIDGLTLNLSFTIETWVRPVLALNMFSVSSVSDSFVLNFTSDSFKMSLSSSLFDAPFETNDAVIIENLWQYIGLTTSYRNSSRDTVIKFWYSGSQINSYSYPGVILTPPAYNEYIGAEEDLSGGMTNFYNGFIWKFCI